MLGRSSPTTAKWLRDTTRWVLDRYDGESLGLGGIEASPEQEVAYLLSGFDHITDPARRESYLAGAIRDLASVFDDTALYSGAPNLITDPLGLTVGEALAGELFPRSAVE